MTALTDKNFTSVDEVKDFIASEISRIEELANSGTATDCDETAIDTYFECEDFLDTATDEEIKAKFNIA